MTRPDDRGAPGRFVLLFAGAIGGLGAVAAAVILRGLTGTRLLAELVIDASTYGLQPRGFSFLLSHLGPAGKPLLFLSVVLLELVLYLTVWRAASRLQRGPVRVVTAALVSTTVLLLLSVLLVLLTPAEMSASGWLEYGLVALVTSGLYATVAGLCEPVLDAPADSRASLGPVFPRRTLLGLPLLAFGGVAVFVIGRQWLHSGGGGVQASYRGMPTPEVTPTPDFYVVSKNLIDPGIDEKRWRLKVGGLSARTVELSYQDILAFPAREQYVTLQCISNEIGGYLISNALWKGVPLRQVLERVEPSPAARFVLFRCEDRYTESLPLDFALQESVLLAYEMNGAPLTPKHGFPLRLLSPGKYGIKHPKWITEISLVSQEPSGYWQDRGWDQEARMNTSSRIDLPAPFRSLEAGTVRVQGIAFAGNRAISRVEVSTDGGESWHDATLQPALSPYTWVLWSYDWPGTDASGQHIEIVARATDGTGELQTPHKAPPYPAGATGYPRVQVTAPRV